MSLPVLPKSSFLTPAVRDYICEHSTTPDEIQQALIEETTKLGDIAIMQISPEQGAFLTIITELVGAQRALEVGTFTGYSALSIARGLAPNGQLLTLDINEEWAAIARQYWQKADVTDRITFEIGPAIETLRSLPEDQVFDLSFIDADKASYISYYEEILKRTRRGGVILVDNVLWFGQVADLDTQDETARIMQGFNNHLTNDNRIERVMLPIADGVTLARKK